MKIIFAFLIFFLLLDAEEKTEKKYGYSYLAIGIQHTNYTQSFKSDQGNYELSSTSSSPYYTTATLTRINKKFGFEIYAASTLFASSTNEYLTSETSNNQHKLDMTLTDVAFTLHYKPINEHHRLTIGGRYTYEVLKRYQIPSDTIKIKSINNTTSSILENKIAAITLDIGYLYMSKIQTGIEGLNYRLGVSIGVPFFSATADTYNSESFNLNPIWGSKITSNAYIGYRIFNGLEIGTYIDYLYQTQFDDTNEYAPEGGYIESKDSIKTLLNYGLIASWSF